MRPCLWRDCPELVVRGYCRRHQREVDRARNAQPHRAVYRDRRWRACRLRAFRRDGWRCRFIDVGGVRCTVFDPSGARLDGHHYPVGLREVLARGLDPFDDRNVVTVCHDHHGAVERAA